MICWTGIAVLAIELCLRSVFACVFCVFACVWCEVTLPLTLVYLCFDIV